jgi:hypothetical protein
MASLLRSQRRALDSVSDNGTDHPEVQVHRLDEDQSALDERAAEGHHDMVAQPHSEEEGAVAEAEIAARDEFGRAAAGFTGTADRSEKPATVTC